MRHKIVSVFIICAMLFGMCNVSYAEENLANNQSLSEKDEKVIICSIEGASLIIRKD